MAPPMICCDSGTLCVVVPWLVPEVWLPSAASGVSRLSKGARFCSGRLCAVVAAASSATSELRDGWWTYQSPMVFRAVSGRSAIPAISAEG
jgi:hypothetical protein